MWGSKQSNRGDYEKIGDDPNIKSQELREVRSTSSERADYENIKEIDENTEHRIFLRRFGGDHAHDTALQALYDHWHGKGHDWIVTDKILHFLRCFFAFIFVIILAVYVNWSDMISCDGTECNRIDFLLPPSAINDVDSLQVVIITLMGILIFGLFLFMIHFVLFDLPRQRSCRRYLDHINVPQINIKNGVCGWDDLVRTLYKHQAHYTEAELYNHQGVPVRLNELHIAQCIMRTENYVIALINSGIVQFPLLNATTYILLKDYLIKWCVFTRKAPTAIHPSASTWRSEVTRNLKVHCVLWAFILFICAPFWVAWRIIYNFFKYGVVFKNDPGRFFLTRTWTTHASVCFREYNELPHCFELRMANSRKMAQDFVDQYPDYLFKVIGQTGSFIFSGIFLLLLLLTILNEGVIANMSFFDKPLLWWMPFILSIALFCSRLGYSENTRQLTFFDPKRGFETLQRFSHWEPMELRNWDASAYENANKIYKLLVGMFPLTLTNFLIEACTIPMTLYHLCQIAKNAESIVTCICDLTHIPPEKVSDNEGKLPSDFSDFQMGSILCFSTFKKQYSCGTLGGSGNDEDVARVRRYLGEHEGKMERSVLGFLVMYPRWAKNDSEAKQWKPLETLVQKSESGRPAEWQQPSFAKNELTMLQTSVYVEEPDEDEIPARLAGAAANPHGSNNNEATKYEQLGGFMETYFATMERDRRR